MKLKDLIPTITENSTQHYNYGCVMLYFDFPEILKIHNAINPSHLYTEDDDSYGIEDEPHCTLLYGLHDTVTIDDVNRMLDTIQFGDCKIYNPSLFENEKYDVLKFEVGYATRGGAFLSKANWRLKKLPYTSDFPDYKPHMTIAYLKPGFGKKYVDMLNNTTSEYVLSPTHIVFSQPNGTKTNISI